MKKSLLVVIFCFGVLACSTSQNTNLENGNTKGNYNQNLEIQKLRNQLKHQNSNNARNEKSVSNQVENSGFETEKNNNTNNKKTTEKHENMHELDPERR